jgi:GTPase SAR1 family protein
MQLDIHKNIRDKLRYFYNIKKIPNIIFNGPSGSGKSTIVNNFINLIYGGNKDIISDFVMYVNCAHGKGIKFIRDELKFFAKMHINSNGGDTFKSIILLNGDKLTVDAQSALRRCIELFSHNTRFFIIVEDKYKLLKPILSRFCEIYVPEPEYKGTKINLYKYNLQKIFQLNDVKNVKTEWLKKELTKSMSSNIMLVNLMNFITKLYEKGYSALDLLHILEQDIESKDPIFDISLEKRYELLIAFNKIKKEFRNEKLLMFFILNFIYLDSEYNMDNISFM